MSKAKTIQLQTSDGKPTAFIDEVIGAGGMKDVFFGPDKSYVVAFFRDSVRWKTEDRQKYAQTKDRLETITRKYLKGIFEQADGEYWKDLLCWPTDVVELEGKGLGIVVPAYQKQYFFEFGSTNNDFLKIKGKEKEGKWFTSIKNRTRFLAERELGDWLGYLKICIKLSRSVARLHAAGLAHSDLSYKNCLVNPLGGNACIIDLDGLVVPGKFPPDVVGTPDFIAPEVVMTANLPLSNPNKKLPSMLTDRYALAVLIYMYLLYRHPLRGDKIHDIDPVIDDRLAMGERALFREHPTDKSNRKKIKNLEKWEEFWENSDKLPFTVTGPYISQLFKRAFIDALHNPNERPTAAEWEVALVKTADLIQPCHNPKCGQKWYVFDNTTTPVCPFCGTPYSGLLPVLNLYSSRKAGSFMPDNHRLMVYKDQSLFVWHINRNVFPNQKLTEVQKKRVGYFTLHKGIWWLVNENLPDLMNVETKEAVPKGGKIELSDGLKILFSREEGGRLAVVQMVGA